MYRLGISILIASSLLGQNRPPQRAVPAGRAEVMYYNGNIITMDPERPAAEALTIAQGRFRAVGTTQKSDEQSAPPPSRST